MDDLRALDQRAARARDQPLPRPRAQPRRARARVGAAGAGGRRRGYRDYFHVFPDREMPDAYERTLPEVFPRLRARQLHLGRRARRLGVDDVQRLPVGPQLVEPRRALRVRRHHPDPGQPRRRGVPARRDRVHLEAAGHQLPEPARGARADPGPAHGGPDRLPRRRCSRPRRSSGRRTCWPTSGRASTTARSATSPTTTG